jgi:hypothetical protein
MPSLCQHPENFNAAHRPASTGDGRYCFAMPGTASSSAAAAGSPGSMRRSCSRSPAAAPPHWAAIAIAVLTVGILPSPITRAATGTVPDARRTRVSAGSRRANGNCCPPATCTWSSPCRVNSLRSRRFLLHLLPRGFMRIRNFGFLANRKRAALLPLCFQLLAGSADSSARTASPAQDHPGSSTHWNCPVCGGPMHVVERLSAAQLLLRSPPLTHLCAA